MVFNATFNNISVISWLSVLFVEETELVLNVFSATFKKISVLLVEETGGVLRHNFEPFATVASAIS
jgi:hypothetical protein